MSNWFGKNCTYFCGKWEENELTGGPDYKESEPELVFCNNKYNKNKSEGSCNQFDCPKLFQFNERS